MQGHTAKRTPNLKFLSRKGKEKGAEMASKYGIKIRCRHRPIFPGSRPPSIFGTNELNFRVRDGNGWTLTVINTDF